LRDWAQRSAYRAVGIYLDVLGLGYKTDNLARRNLTGPAC